MAIATHKMQPNILHKTKKKDNPLGNGSFAFVELSDVRRVGFVTVVL